jgi:hypothetical protein
MRVLVTAELGAGDVDDASHRPMVEFAAAGTVETVKTAPAMPRPASVIKSGFMEHLQGTDELTDKL